MSLELVHHPEKCIEVRREATCVAAIWFGAYALRPFVNPFLGPGDRELTRWGHPEDPVGHSHHRSIWIGHAKVSPEASGENGKPAESEDFWAERRGAGRVEVTEARTDGDGERTEAILECVWITAGDRKLLTETRRHRFESLRGGELALEIDTSLRAVAEPVALEVSNFGLLGIRVARTLRVHEGLGGRLLNSNEGENEAGCFGQHAAWIDASGPVPARGVETAERSEAGLPALIAGIACFDHPGNSGDETLWHARDDGWFGPSLTRTRPRRVTSSEPLRVRYRLESHAGRPGPAEIAARYRRWRAESGS